MDYKYLCFFKIKYICKKIKKMKNVKDLGLNSQLVHAGDFEDAFGSAVTPIYQTSTFAFRNAQQS